MIKNLSDRNIVSLPFVQRSLSLAQQSQTLESLDAAGKEIHNLISILRSPQLGIGSESIKLELKTLDSQITAAIEQSPEQQIRTYRNGINQLTGLIGDLGRDFDGVRLGVLRSVRRYVEELKQYAQVFQDLEKNEALLDKSRQKIAYVIWYFNNQELSTRALEKQDPEVFSHWFAQAKQEWESFNANKGLAYRAPDQPRNTVLEKTFKSQEPSPNYFSYLLTILPVMLVILFLYFIFSRQMKGVGSSAMNFGKSPAQAHDQRDK